MSTTSRQETPVDLNEVFEQIKQSGQRTFTDKDGNKYCSVYESRLRQWAMALVAAKKDMDTLPITARALQQARDEVASLVAASERKDLKLQELKDLAANAEKAAKTQRAAHQKEIAETKKSLQDAKDRFANANAAKADTAKALLEAEKRLKDPQAKFIPEEALALQREVKGLRSDLELANAAMATERTNQHTLNKQIDALYKAAAGKDKELEDARRELSDFKKQLAAAQQLNADDLDLDAIDYDGLHLAFGARGVEKLKAVLAIPAWDVRGRIQRLTGFFHVAASHASKTFFAMVDVLDHALSLVRDKSSSWAGVIFPWVNGLLKDIVFFQLKPVKMYRLELESMIEAVKAKMPAETLTEKVDAAKTRRQDPRSWQERLDARKADIKAKLSAFDKARKGWLQRCGTFIRESAQRARTTFRKTYASFKGFSSKVANSVSNSIKIGFLFFKASFNARDRPYDHRSDPRRFTHDYDLSTGEWVPHEVELFNAEKLD
nr:chromosome segregation protein [Phomopsis asparagi Fusarivirus 1]